MPEFGEIWRDLQRGARASSRKAILLTAAILSVIVLVGLEKGDREANAIKLRDVVARLHPPLHAVSENMDEAVATEDNAWKLLLPPFRKPYDIRQEKLIKDREDLYGQFSRLSSQLLVPTSGSTDLRALHEELARIDSDIRSVRAAHDAQVSTLDAQEKVRLATRAAEGIAQPVTQNPKWPDTEALLNAHERAQVLVDQRRRMDMLLFRQQRVLVEIERAPLHPSNAGQELQRQDVEYSRSLEVNASHMAALVAERDRFLDDAHEDVKVAFTKATKPASEGGKKRNITGLSTPDEFLLVFFDRQSAVHAIYDLIWYAALAIAVVSLSAFIFVAVIQLLSLPSKTTEAFDARIADLLEKAPELLKQSMTADALKTGAASIIALVVGFRAVSGTADLAKSSPVNEKATIDASVLKPSDLAWSAGRGFSRESTNGREGRDGQAGRDGSAGREGSVGRDANPGRDGIAGRDGVTGRDGAPGRDGREGEPGPQGPGGAPPVDVWTASIEGLEKQTRSSKSNLDELRKDLNEESEKRAAAERKSAELLKEVAELKKNSQDLLSTADELKKGRDAVIAQGALWDVRPWWEDARLTSRYEVGPLSLAILKTKLGIKDSADKSNLTPTEAVSYLLYDHLEDLQRRNVQLTAAQFEEEITTGITADLTRREFRNIVALIMDVCRLPR